MHSLGLLWSAPLRAAAQASAGNAQSAMEHLRNAARCGMTALDTAKYSELAALRSRADFPKELQD
jgi:hypothetical protein